MDQKPEQINFLKWFNIHDRKHLRAYLHLQEYGFWPPGFLPENRVMPSGWAPVIAARMADAWVNYMLNDMSSWDNGN